MVDGENKHKRTKVRRKPTQKELEAKANDDALALAQLIYDLYKLRNSP